MLIVLTVAAVMLGVAVTTIHLLLRAEHEATKSACCATSVTRLAHAFRDDLHFARDVELPPAEPGKPVVLVATLDAGGTVRYELDGNRVTRMESGGAGEATRDDFYFPPETRLTLERAKDAGLWRLAIELPRAGLASSKPTLPTGPTVSMTVEASPAPFLRRKSIIEKKAASP